jgi:GntR family transcriptional repressor for pyruvate dehydrogenase complex
VARSLLSAISSGALRPGQKLPTERELAAQFSVSQTVIRETIHQLESKGILRRTGPRRVEVVAIPSSRVAEALELFLHGARSTESVSMRDIGEVRTMIDLTVVRLAAQRVTEDDLRALGAEIDAMEVDTTPERASGHDAEFHRLVAAATHNPIFSALEEAFSRTVLDARLDYFAEPTAIAQTAAKYRAVIDALRARDEELAVASMIRYYDLPIRSPE